MDVGSVGVLSLVLQPRQHQKLPASRLHHVGRALGRLPLLATEGPGGPTSPAAELTSRERITRIRHVRASVSVSVHMYCMCVDAHDSLHIHEVSVTV